MRRHLGRPRIATRSGPRPPTGAPILLAGNAVQAGHDGSFRSDPLAGRTVNVKTYGDAFTGLDTSPHECYFYLIFSGPRRPAGVVHHQWQISAVYLFDTLRLLDTLNRRGVKIGIATSIRRADLDAARIFPDTNPASPLRLTSEQTVLLSLFAAQVTPRLAADQPGAPREQ